MDDPLVPKSVNGCTRLTVQIICALAVIFIFVAALLTFIQGGKTDSGGWVVVGLGFILTTSTTGVLAWWVMKNELEESKHFYLIVSQALALVVLAAGFLAVMYAGETPYYYIGGSAGPVIMEQGTQPRGGPLQIMLNNNQSQIITIGQTTCQPFLFPTMVGEDERYAVTLKMQPSGSLCQLIGGNGVAKKNLLGNDGVKINCQTAWLIGGIMLYSGGAPWPTGLTMVNNPNTPSQEMLPIVQSSGNWYFPTPVLNGAAYSVTFAQTPPSLTCTVEKNTGLAQAPVQDIQIKCSPAPTTPPTPPPTKGV